MKPRMFAVGAALWDALFLVVYGLVVHDQQGQVAWWYVAVVAVSAVGCALAAAGLAPRVGLAAGLAAAAGAMLVGLLSVGLLLLPSVVLAALGLGAVLGRRSHGFRNRAGSSNITA